MSHTSPDNSTHYDCIIVGQGIAGTMLSYQLLQQGKHVLVIDNGVPNIASCVASGLINPVTGKKWVPSWLHDELMSVALPIYHGLEQMFSKPYIKQYPLYSIHPNEIWANAFEERIREGITGLQTHIRTESWASYFHIPHGMGCISPSYVIHTQQLHDDWRRYLAANNLLLEEWCDWNDIEMFRDKVVYKKAFTADYIIACEGALGAENPYFSDVKFHLNKGEAILLSIPDLSENGIYKIGELNIIPQGNNQFWIGSIFNREYTDTKPSDTFKRQVIDALNQSLKLPYKIIGHKAALRPATPGQKPIVGRHPLHPRLCILSGMGSKGYCLAPYFSQQLIAHIYRQQPLSKEVDIARFY